MWYESREEKCEQYVDVWDCGDDLARLKCRTCAKQYLVDAPICHACHAHKTLTNRVSIRTELLFTFLMSGLKLYSPSSIALASALALALALALASALALALALALAVALAPAPSPSPSPSLALAL